MSATVQPKPSPFEDLAKKLGIPPERLREPVVDGEAWKPHRDVDAGSGCAGTLRVDDKSGPVWIATCDECRFELGIPVLRTDPERLKEHRLRHAGIPERFAGHKFVDDDPQQKRAIKAVRQWLREFKSDPLPAVALYGEPGRGKSHLLALMVETLIKRYATDAIFRSAVGLLDELKAGFDNAEYETRWHRLLNVPVLALDDLGAERVTDWKRERLERLLDYRYAKELPLLVTTNAAPAQWEDRFGERASSRLRGLCVPLELRGVDKRYMGEQERIG